ncbi:hypothetical protein [Corynebacterium anserum]|uniref:Uncharacterized protein n=1 Tax=Corynebacterium anserum TaxID=2684406 RepID=A0A7G7YLS5_9CORY|nr:hypothetical protein [Corynebacterium anserum]QNH95445.1 hypothetical protein GP473_00870 [Corynebacterium anserum]
MSTHKKNWLRRLLGEVGPFSSSGDRPDAPSGSRPDVPSGSADPSEPSASSHEPSASSHESADAHSTPNSSVPSSSPADATQSRASKSPATSQGDHVQHGHHAEENRARTAANNTRNGNTAQQSIFDPAELSDVEFYRSMRVKLQPIEQAGLTGKDDDFSPDSPVRPFSEDSVIRLSLDMPSAQAATRPQRNGGQSPLDQQPRRLREALRGASLRSQREAGHASFPLSKEHFDDRGPVEDLYRMGYRNLWQDLIDSDLHVTELSPSPQEKVWVFEGSSPYVGSSPIFLEELVQRYIPEMDMSTGLLFTMPSSAQMLVRNVTTGMELFHTIGLLATASADEYFKSADKLNPRLHLWHDGQIETISDIKLPKKGELQTEIQIKPTAYLIAQMNQGPDAPDDWMKGFGNDGPSLE